ncbi:MAG: NAD-dependent epimerase/dehydratase family protein [Actinomycetota bacterium]|nr:NAD-dependent epimerase/dehydratase family protein [Actinomycetota bacterium]
MESASGTPERWARRCVVTGSAGFIGSTLSTRLVRDGWKVTGIDAFTDSYDPVEKVVRAANLARVAGTSLVVGDLVDLDLARIFDGAEVVFHLAGRAGVRPSFALEDRYVHDNVVATERVLDAARRAGVRRVVYASSSSVYGDGDAPFREAATPNPISPYGRTKLEAELQTLAAAGTGLETVALRYFTVFGPGQRPDMGLRLFAEAALTGRPVTLFGDGTQRRDFTYVHDVAAATEAAADAPASGMAINVGGGADVSLLDVFDVLRALVGTELLIDVQPFARGDVRVTSADLTRARELLGFVPEVPFAAGYERQVSWLRDRMGRAMELSA